MSQDEWVTKKYEEYMSGQPLILKGHITRLLDIIKHPKTIQMIDQKYLGLRHMNLLNLENDKANEIIFFLVEMIGVDNIHNKADRRKSYMTVLRKSAI